MSKSHEIGNFTGARGSYRSSPSFAVGGAPMKILVAGSRLAKISGDDVRRRFKPVPWPGSDCQSETIS